MTRFFMTVMGFSLALSGSLAAGPKPNPSSPADPKEIHKMHNGKTSDWSKGGAYWGRKGKFQAVWDGSIADGKWYVTGDGAICYDANWTWEKNGAAESKNIVNCWKHVVDSEGTFWQRNHEKEDWYKLNPDKIQKGNKIKSLYKSTATAIGS